MEEAHIDIEGTDGTGCAFRVLADPERANGAGVIVIHDMLGFNDDTRRIGRRLAENGYHVLAPDLYDGDGPRALCVMRTIMAHARSEGPVFDRLDAARVHLADRDDVDADRIGVIGFCMGGGFAVTYASSAPVAVTAPFYGTVPRNVEQVRGICPVVGGWGERDVVFTRQGRRLVRHLDELGVEHDIAFYPDAGHAYMNRHHENIMTRLGAMGPLKAEYVEDAAEDSWRRVFAFFDRHLSA